MFESAPKKLIIDTDAGIDDAIALMLCAAAHRARDTEILAITCVNGNTSVDNVCRNVLRVLKTVHCLLIPVYRGAEESLIHTPPPENYHGEDGFGDVEFHDQPDISLIKKEHAVNALLRLVDQYPGEITLLCWGPLTNVALAMKLNPEFTSKLKDLHVMGGNVEGVGNVVPGAEFNFHQDAEAAHIVLSKTAKLITLLPWETAFSRNTITLEWREEVLGKIQSPQMNLINRAEASWKSKATKRWISCDPMAAAISLRPDIVLSSVSHHTRIELHGTITRGGTVVDYKSPPDEFSNVSIIKTIDVEKYKSLLVAALGT